MTARCPSELALESHLLDPERSGIAEHVAGCPRCAQRLEQMRAEGADFARNVLPLTVDAVEQAAARIPWWRRPAFVFPVPAIAAAAAVLLLLRPAGPPDDYVGLKGGAGGLGLTVFAAGPSGVAPLPDEGIVAASAPIRFRVRASEGCHLWIASIDAAGAVSRLYPPPDAPSGWVVASEQDLPGGAILDGRAGPERIYAICTPHALAWTAIVATVHASTGRPASLRAPAPLAGLPHGANWTTLLLEKRR
jgi:hypothetical protein